MLLHRAEAEIYSLALFTNEILSLSYAVEEAGFKFPKPAVVQVDNQAAIAFSRQADTGGRSKLRHIDLRQEWAHLLPVRESGLVSCMHISTVSNLADMLTKALDTSTFKRLRDQLMYSRTGARCEQFGYYSAVQEYGGVEHIVPDTARLIVV